METSLPSAGKIIDPHIDEFTGPLASTRAGVVSLMARVSDQEDARNKTKREPESLVKMTPTEAKMLKDHVTDEQDGALSRYLGVLRSI